MVLVTWVIQKRTRLRLSLDYEFANLFELIDITVDVLRVYLGELAWWDAKPLLLYNHVILTMMWYSVVKRFS